MRARNTIAVAGAGVAELPVPGWMRLLRASILCALFAACLSGAFAVAGWNWLARGVTAGLAVAVAAVVTAAAGCVIVVARSAFLASLLGLRRPANSGTAPWVYGGYTGVLRALLAPAAGAALLAVTGALIAWSAARCPLPERLERLRIDARPAEPRRLMPLYLWDYATWIDPQWFDDLELALPYEQGPPQRLLGRIHFRDSRTGALELELHGRRPRAYQKDHVTRSFDATGVQPRDWPLIWNLQREAGLIDGGHPARSLYLMEIRPGSLLPTLAIGLPWGDGVEARGRFFYWGPDGSVFQVKCSAPCRLARLLELVEFPPDPRGSHGDRLAWTHERLQRLLAQPPAKPGTLARTRQENLMAMYLISSLTLDPRDAEAYFHVGKLARNRETAIAAARYGRDVGLEGAKIAELQMVAERLSH